MALNSGIKCNQLLLDTTATSTDFGFIITIKNEEFMLEKVLQEKSCFQESLEAIVYNSNTPFYIVAKKDNLLVTCIPDNANVRDKMLYASSKGLLAKEIGISGLKWDISCIKDLNYQSYLEFNTQDKPYTERELQEQKVKNDLALIDTSSNVRQGHMVGLSFTIQQELSLGIQELKERGRGGVIFKLENDTLELESSVQVVDLSLFSSKFQGSSPRFGFYLDEEIMVFLYLCPVSASVKEKMKYSSARASAVSVASSLFDSFKKIELDDYKEIAVEVQGLKAPSMSKSSDGLKFSKPSRPGSRVRNDK